jgi:hypothetical protein
VYIEIRNKGERGMKKLIWLTCLAALALGLFAMPVAAAPSLGGYTGLLFVPTASTLGDTDYNIAYFSLGDDSHVWTGNLGMKGGFELGITRVKYDSGYELKGFGAQDAFFMGNNTEETLLNAKYNFRPQTSAHKPGLAVGVADATGEIDTTAYVVATQSLSKVYKPNNPQLHVGIGSGMFDGFFAGVSATYSKLTLMGEYDSRDINLGARLAVTNDFRIHAGWINGLDDLAIGASFNKMF